jgi:hypothetical protein
MSPETQAPARLETVTLVTRNHKTGGDASRQFRVHPATVGRLLRKKFAASSPCLPPSKNLDKKGVDHENSWRVGLCEINGPVSGP